MKKIKKYLSSLLSAALLINLTAPAVQEYLVSADDTIESLSMVMKAGFENYEKEIDISKFGFYYTGDPAADGEIVSRIQEVIGYVMLDPELFYLDTTNKYDINFKHDPNTDKFLFSGVTVDYLNTYDEVQPLIAEFNEKVDEIIDTQIEDGMTELEKALKIHDYLVLNTQYDVTGEIPDLNDGASAYDVLVCGNGVCQGYAQAYNVLMDRIGMESIMVTSKDLNHAWNLVKVDGEWYHVDATWDDPVPDSKGRVNHKYFLLSDEEIQKTSDYRDYVHYGWESKGFKATSTKYDNAFWAGVTTEMFIDNGKWYFVSEDGTYSTYVEATGEVNAFVSIADQPWPVWGENSVYLGKYATLIVSDGFVYFNTPEMIFKMRLDGSEKSGLKYVNPYETNGYVYGLVLKDNTLYAVIKQSPKDEGYLYEAMHLELENYSTVNTLLSMIDEMKDGEEKVYPMDTEKYLPAAAIEHMKDRDIKITLDLGDYNWNISGKKITAEEAKDLNLEIKQDQGLIPEEMLDSITPKGSEHVELNLEHHGPFGLTADINYSLGEQFADNVAVLYYYNEANATMDKLDFMLVDRFGNIDIALEHASSYALVLRDMRAPEDPIIDGPEEPPEETTIAPVTTIPAPEEMLPATSETVITEATSESTVTIGEEIEVMTGDVNMDGIVDLMDLTMISVACLGEVELEGAELTAADVTGDHKVDLTDLACMKQYVMNIITSFAK